MGRPKDQFAWAQVEKLENGKWKCKHCKEVHSGAASRIRNHLSGQGNGITPCKEANEAIQNEALKKITPKKRVRGNSSAVPTSKAAAAPPSSYDNAAAAAAMREGRERDVDPLPNNNNAVYDNNLSNPNDQYIDYLISKSAPTGWNKSTHEEPAVSTSTTRAVKRSIYMTYSGQGGEHKNAAAAAAMRQGREREVNGNADMINEGTGEYAESTRKRVRQGGEDDNAAPAPTDGSVALSTDWKESTHKEPAVSTSRTGAAKRSIYMTFKIKNDAPLSTLER
ncbi:hypothetical protein V2J09_012352 [Rumex salicifolius]